MSNWSPQQDRALLEVSEWLKNSKKQVFRLFGYAGTGKTTLARHFAEDIAGAVHFAAYTGKAAHVLKQKGCANASTIHGLIYHTMDKSGVRLLELENECAALINQVQTIEVKDKIRSLQTKIDEERKSLHRPGFTLNHNSDARYAKLIVIDECSMVDAKMGEDLLSFGVKVLVLGDPAQLPPVASAGFFTNHEPDIMLTEIHRQAGDNPIIRMATDVREGRSLSLGNYGSSKIITKDQLNKEIALEADQILVGRNKTRTSINNRVRVLKGMEGICSDGEKIVCLRNNNELGIMNGSLWTVENYYPIDENTCVLNIIGENGLKVETLAHTHYFLSKQDQLSWWDKKDAEEFDYGYALTTHKSQGSQWDNVLLFDESSSFRNDATKWLYTAITRAANKITIAR